MLLGSLHLNQHLESLASVWVSMTCHDLAALTGAGNWSCQNWSNGEEVGGGWPGYNGE